MVDIHAGDKVLVEFSTFGDRFLSVVTDVRKDGCLLVYSPMPEPVVKRLQTDKKVLVRYAHEGKLRGFKTRVMNQVHSSETILVLQEPADTFHAEERAEPRCVTSFPATVMDGDRAAQAVVEDISKSCARVRFLNGDVPFIDEVGGVVQLTFHPLDMADGYEVECRIKSAAIRDNVRYVVLEFNPSEEAMRSRIASFIEAQVCCALPRELS